jgi:hypothetical protein
VIGSSALSRAITPFWCVKSFPWKDQEQWGENEWESGISAKQIASKTAWTPHSELICR